MCGLKHPETLVRETFKSVTVLKFDTGFLEKAALFSENEKIFH